MRGCWPALAASAAALLASACGTSTIALLPPDGSTDGGGDATAGGDAPADVVEELCGACPCGLVVCSGACVDTVDDPVYCGSCAGTGIEHNAFCRGGTQECLPGLTMCAGSCIDFLSDPDHCGSCNATPCAQGQKCENGQCGSGSCTAPLVGCPVSGRTACIDMSRGWPHCGSCSLVCAPDEYCAGGACHRYAPATPCTSCPCAADCARALSDAGSTACCPGFLNGTPPLCVEGNGCTP